MEPALFITIIVQKFPAGSNDCEDDESTCQHERKVVIEHPSGKLDVVVTYETEGRNVNIRSAGVIRTARLLFTGLVRVPNKTAPVEEPKVVQEVQKQIFELYKSARHRDSVGKSNLSPITSPRSMTSRGMSTSAITSTGSPVSQLPRGVSAKNSNVQPSSPKPNAIQLAMVPAESVISSLGSAFMSFWRFSSTSTKSQDLASSKADESCKVNPTSP